MLRWILSIDQRIEFVGESQVAGQGAPPGTSYGNIYGIGPLSPKLTVGCDLCWSMCTVFIWWYKCLQFDFCLEKQT